MSPRGQSRQAHRRCAVRGRPAFALRRDDPVVPVSRVVGDGQGGSGVRHRARGERDGLRGAEAHVRDPVGWTAPAGTVRLVAVVG